MAQTVTYKLITGQEIIGRLIKAESPRIVADDVGVRLEDVRVIEYGFTGPGQLQMGLAPFAVSSLNGEIVIMRSAIIAVLDPDNIPRPILDAYIKEVSGIEIAGAGSIQGVNR
jgi:hypothetical protein